jgi:hypothetical protein
MKRPPTQPSEGVHLIWSTRPGSQAGSKGAALRRAWGPEECFRSLLRTPKRRIEHYYWEETKPCPIPEVSRWPVQN